MSSRSHRNAPEASYSDILRTWWPLGAKSSWFVADPIYIAFIMRISPRSRTGGALHLRLALPSDRGPVVHAYALGNVFGKNVANIRRTRFVACRRDRRHVDPVGIAFTPLVSFLQSCSCAGGGAVDGPDRPPVPRGLSGLKSICMISQGI